MASAVEVIDKFDGWVYHFCFLSYSVVVRIMGGKHLIRDDVYCRTILRTVLEIERIRVTYPSISNANQELKTPHINTTNHRVITNL